MTELGRDKRERKEKQERDTERGIEGKRTKGGGRDKDAERNKRVRQEMWNRDRENELKRQTCDEEGKGQRLRQRNNSVLRPSAWPAAGPEACTMPTGTS